jgi:hypothetical protein
MFARRTALLVAAWLTFVAGGPSATKLPDAAAQAVDAVSVAELRASVETLASDSFAGRGVAEPGNRAAEEYLCSSFVNHAVQPAAADGSCYQPFQIYRPRLGWRAHLAVTDASGATLADYAAGAEFYPLPETGRSSVQAPVVLAGHGVSAPELKHDDYAHVDVRGAIAVVIEGAPALGGGPFADGDLEELGSIDRKIADAEAHGARGLLVVSPALDDIKSVWPEHVSPHTAEYRRYASLDAHPSPVAAISERAAAPITRALAGHAHLIATLTPDLVAEPVTVHNVLGLVEGRDLKHHDEMVVVGAHMDHEGTDESGRVYHGADDNASGTAAVIAAASAFARAAAMGERPARAVLFALWNGEERGELGSQAFVDAAQPARHIVANINLDMVGRHEEVPDPDDWRFRGFHKVDPSTSAATLHVLGYSYAPSLAAELRDANASVGLTLLEDYDLGAQDLLERSDNWSFLSRGIPALFLTTGLHPDYHTPDDTAARIDYDKLERVTRLAARAAWIVADGPAPKIQAHTRR